MLIFLRHARTESHHGNSDHNYLQIQVERRLPAYSLLDGLENDKQARNHKYPEYRTDQHPADRSRTDGSIARCTILSPARLLVTANSTIRMAFLANRPISMIRVICR